MSTTTRTVFYRFQILSDVKGSPTFVQHETKSALFLGDEQLTTWKPDAPTDIPLPLATDLLGAVNAALLARITELEAAVAALATRPAPATSGRRLVLDEVAGLAALAEQRLHLARDVAGAV